MRKTLLCLQLLLLTVFFCLSVVSPLSLADTIEVKDNSLTSTAELINGELPGYELVTHNNVFEMYIERSQYNIAIKNTASGDVYFSFIPDVAKIPELSGPSKMSAQSQIIVSYIDKISRVHGMTNSLVSCVRKDGIKTESISNGIKISYEFPDVREDFIIPVAYTLTETGLSAKILFNEIIERSDALITSISLLPYFETAYSNEEGFILIPDGSGSIINLNSGRPGMSVYEQMVYGKEPALTTVQKTWENNPICMPIYGMQKEGKAFLTVIDQGAALATITASPSNGESLLNYVYSSFTYRETDSVVMADATWASKEVTIYSRNTSTCEKAGISIYLLSGDAARLSGMADAYHLYLGKRYGITESADKEVSFCAELFGGIKKKKSFLGIPYNDIIPLTTFQQAKSIIENISNSGIKRQKIIFSGAMDGGMNTSAPVSADFERKLGGNKGFQQLLEFAGISGNIMLLPDVEFQKIYKNRFGWWSYFFTAKNVSLAPIIDFRYKDSTYFKNLAKTPASIMSPSKLLKEINLFTGSMTQYDPRGISTGSLGNYLSSDFSSKHFYDRQRSADTVSDGLDSLKMAFANVVVKTGFEYAAAHATDVYCAPVTDSGFDISTHSVPFYAMAFKGYINLAGSPINGDSDYTKSLLECIENGIAPNFIFTWEDTSNLSNTDYDDLLSTRFSVIFPKAADIFQRYCDVYDGINDQRIINYEILTDKVSITTLEGGKRIAVNYSDEDYEIDHTVVPAHDFVILGNA